jgi:shikimate kinase
MAREHDRILLIGMMGSGKSTVGRELAKRTGWPFLDNDALVRELTGREPQDIDAEDGEEALHAAETAAFRAATLSDGPAIIAVAGAVVDDDAERARLADAGHVVWLRGRPETLRGRIGEGTGRRSDALDIDWIRARVVERAPRYAEVANQVIEIENHRPSAIAREILAAVKGSSAG